MKCIAILMLLVGVTLCNGQDISLDFLNDNLLMPLLESIQNNALALLTSQLGSLFGSLFGKRALPNVNMILQSLEPFIQQVKQIYQQLFIKFQQIMQNIGNFAQKPDFARIEFVYTGLDAENQASRLSVSNSLFQPLITMVQQHLGALISQLENVITGVLGGNILQPLIGTGNLLQPLIGTGNLLQPL